MSLLVVSVNSRLFFHTLTAENMHSFCNRDNLLERIQMQLSIKINLFTTFCCISEIFIKFWTFGIQDEPDSLCFSKIRYCKKRGQLNTKKVPFQNTLCELRIENLRNYELRTMWLDKYLKSLVSEHLHYSNILHFTFIFSFPFLMPLTNLCIIGR